MLTWPQDWQTKWEAEAVVREIEAREGLEAVIVRPAWVYGPRCPRTENSTSASSRADPSGRKTIGL